MLMAIPIGYIILSFPIFIVLIHGWITRILYSEALVRDSYSFNTAYTIGIILMYIDSSINILFYIMIGKNLRHHFLSIIPLKMKKCLCPDRLNRQNF